MATAKAFRRSILECAKEAMEAEPTDINARARSFTARLSGSMGFHEELDIETALRELLGLDTNLPTDGA
jgi:hypothetical protein